MVFVKFVKLGEVEDPPAFRAPERNRGVNCPGCGRFAKFLGERHWYDGNGTQITLSTRCSRCGDLSEDCV